MLLLQWGRYDSGQGERFEVDFTRQFIVETEEDPPVLQLQAALYFPRDVLDDLASGQCWCSSPAELDSYRSTLASLPVLIALGDRVAQDIVVILEVPIGRELVERARPPAALVLDGPALEPGYGLGDAVAPSLVLLEAHMVLGPSDVAKIKEATDELGTEPQVAPPPGTMFRRTTKTTAAIDPRTGSPYRVRTEATTEVGDRQQIEVQDTTLDWSAAVGCASEP
jgi:hypothetical protein